MLPVFLAANLLLAPVVPFAPVEPSAPVMTAPSRFDAPSAPASLFAVPLAAIPEAIAGEGPLDEEPPLPVRIRDPHIVVVKSKRELQLWSETTVLRTYRVALGLDPVQPKTKKGDDATPEGTYYICLKNPQSKYDKALALSYPGPVDAERGLANGVISDAEYRRIVNAWATKQAPPFNTALGGDVCIHGAGSSWDWTAGCIALNAMDIDELYRVIPLGTSVEIRP